MRIALLNIDEIKAIDRIGLSVVLEWQSKQKAAISNPSDWKRIGAEFRDKYELTTMEALDLLRLE